jgi:DNA-binding CsgD family transcriptional regulator
LDAQTDLGVDRQDTLARGLRLVRQHPDLGSDADGIFTEYGRTLYGSDKFVEAREVLQRAVRRTEEHGMFAEIVLAIVPLMMVELALGNCEEAMALAYRARQLDEDTGRMYWNVILQSLARAELAGGRIGKAQEFATQAVAESERVGDLDTLMISRYVLGVCHLAAGDAGSALEPLRQATAEVRVEGMPYRVRTMLAHLTEALVRVGDIGQARAVLSDLRAPTDKAPRRSAEASVDRAEALVLMLEGRLEEAAEKLAAVVSEQRALGMRLEVVRTLMASAEVERRRRRRGAARSLLEQARQICLDCRANPLQERIEAELARLEPGRPGQELTPMEERIAAMVVAGATNREIAETLAIGRTTVESSLSNIYRKLGLRSRVDLVRHRIANA